MAREKVGIVIINYNSGKYLRLTLKSLLMAKNDISYIVGVIDNGSAKQECQECREYMDELRREYPAAELLFFSADKNLGFSGGNNVVIKEFMKRDDITHICLLNSDVILTDYWLDYLIEKDCDVIGPVTNAAGNEQTIEIDYQLKNTDDPDAVFTPVNEFAAKRCMCYRNYVVDTDLVTFFATVFKRTVIENVGLLDEQFYPGSYEDDDYCVRILNAGFRIAIARDCFLHHFGSGSFARLNMEERKNIGNINRERFEKKWKCRWEDRTWRLLESCRQDMDFLLKKSDQIWARDQIDLSVVQVEELLKDWGDAIRFFTSQADKPEEIPACSYNVKQLIKMIRVRIKRKIHMEIDHVRKKWNHFVHRKKIRKEQSTEMERIYRLISDAQAKGHKPICVFAPMYNKENEKDGYIQRIKAIDTTVLSNMCRIYLYDEGVDCLEMRFDFIDGLHGYIVFNSHNTEHLQEIVNLTRKCGKTYTHSLLRFIEDRTNKELWKIFDLEGVKHYWDMHGTVPEEYTLSGSELGCQLANNIEAVLAEKADTVVVVTEAMGKFLRKKYPLLKAQIIVVPIFNDELLVPVENNTNHSEEDIVITYAGGIQPWQNIRLMQDIIDQTYERYRFKIFVPSPQEFMDLWEDRKAACNVFVESKAPDELYKEYGQCDFGFVLRDAGPVNYVACPTKIVEYLKFGVIPVLKSEEIGDFVHFGMKYISYKDIVRGITLSKEERQEITEHNYGVLKTLKQIYINGISSLKAQVED